MGEGHGAETSGPELPPEQIAEWLGIPPDGRLLCQPRHHHVWVVWFAGAFVWLWVATAATGLIVLPTICLLVLAPLAVLLTLDRVTAEVHGLTARVRGRTRCYGWHEVEEITDRFDWTVVNTTQGWFRVHHYARHADRIVHTLNAVLRARDVGLRLPVDRPVPDEAISAGEAVAAGEHGISKSG
ncbi:MAG: hypothetical protein HYU66_05215 [Armatimonadetes bacterium]|nr:hypothetical protein [Armatimonadota bacterium]